MIGRQDRKSQHNLNYSSPVRVDFSNSTTKQLPMQLQNIISFFENYPLYLQLGVLLGLAAALAALLSTLLLFILRTTSQQLRSQAIKLVSHNIRIPLTSFLTATLSLVLWGGISVGDEAVFYYRPLVGIMQTLVYLLGAWLLIRLIKGGADGIRAQYEEDNESSIKDRKILTQLQYLEQIALIVIGIIAIALVLLQFENVKSLGATILTSAGVTGIIVGLAAQKSIANLLAGFQIAFTQPIRINDRLNIKGEVGHVEDITLTYVVLRIWDERRMIIPLQHFIDNPFENWTHTDTQLLGTVFIFADYTLPVEALRTVLEAFLADNPAWDGRVAKVQVTDTNANSMQIRLLISATDAATLFGLRCEVREHIIAFIRDHYPENLPKARVVGLSPNENSTALLHSQRLGQQPT